MTKSKPHDLNEIGAIFNKPRQLAELYSHDISTGRQRPYISIEISSEARRYWPSHRNFWPCHESAPLCEIIKAESLKRLSVLRRLRQWWVALLPGLIGATFAGASQLSSVLAESIEKAWHRAIHRPAEFLPIITLRERQMPRRSLACPISSVRLATILPVSSKSSMKSPPHAWFQWWRTQIGGEKPSADCMSNITSESSPSFLKKRRVVPHCIGVSDVASRWPAWRLLIIKISALVPRA